LTLRQVKGAYNFMAEGKALADDEDAVAAVKSLDEITRDVSVENAETEKSKQVAQTKETSITPNEFYAEWKTRLPNEKITVSDVAKGWGITSSAATALLNKLVDQGLVTKKYWSATRVTDYSLASSPGEEKRNPGEGEPAPERANNQASSSLSDILGGQPAQIISDVTGTLSVAGQRVPFYWMLVDRDILNPTTDRADNQFRDRNRAASAEQIANMAGNLDHELLVDSPTMGDGAPVLAVDKQTVIAGNGRVMAIGAAYRQNKAERYKTYLADNAEKWGFTRAQVDNMDMPVLVRVFSNPVDIQAAAIASNEAGGASISALEQARIDGLRLGDLTNFNPDDNGNFNTVANRSFIRQFLANMPVNQRGAFQTADGSLSKEGVTRLRNAVLYRAYGDSDVLSRIAETTDEGQRNLLNALVAIAPLAARVKDDINSGDLYDLDITADIVEATNLLRMIKEEGKFSNAEDYFKQQNLFEDPFSDESKQLLLYFERNLRSSKAIKEFLGDYYAAVSALGSPKQISLLDDAVPGKLKLLKRASDENTRSKAEPETSLFDQATGRNSPANRRQPNENGVVETNDAGQQQTETVNPNEPSTRGSVERNRQDDTAQDGLGGGAVRQESGGTARDTGRTGGDIETQRQESVGDRGLPAVGAATGGERGDQPMDAATGQFRLEKSLARGAERERGAIAGSERVEAGQAGSGAVEGVVEGVVKRNPVDYAKRLQDIAYSTSELVDGNRKAMLALSSALGKSGRDDILSETLGISRSEAHAINNQLDGRQAHRLRKEDMEDIYEQFPPLRKIVDEAKPSSIIAVYQTQTGKIAAQVTRTVIGGRESYSYTGEVGASSGDREHVLQSLKRNFQGKRNIHLVRGEDFAELEAKPEVPTPEAKINLNTPKEPETPTAAIEGLLDGEAESLIDNAINAANWQELKAATQAIKDRYGVHLYQVPQGQPAKDGGKVWHWYDLSNDTTYGMPMTEAEARVKLRKGLIEAQANKQRDIDLRAKYPVLPTGKEADTYKSTLSNRSAVSRFYTIAKEVGEIGQAYGPQQVYVFKGELVRLEYPSVSNRDYAYIHKVQPSDVTGWKKTKLAKEWQAKPSSPDEAKRNPGRNEPAKPDVPKQELGNEQSGEIVGVTSDSPHKTNSSYGNWAVDVVVKIPFGNGTISESRFFFNKSDAVKFINDTKAKLGNEQLEPIPDETLDDLIAATHNEAKLKAKQAAEKIAVIPNNRANIDATLPILTEGQREDVHFAETRWDKPDGYGVLFANGTGTGKTYVGLGAIKRSVSQGKGNVLIVVPSDAIAQGWIRSGKDLNLDIQSLPDTKTAGKGVVITTFANLGMNDALASREWDLVVADEAHYLMNNAQATVTAALERLRAITYNPLGAQDRAQMLNRTLFDDWSRMMKNAARSRANQDTMDEILRADEAEANRLDAEWQAHRRNVKNDIQARQGKDRTRALFLSATPFAYEKNVAWGEGYLFDFPRSESSRYNEPTGFDKFMVQHFGYRMRYNKLNEPDVNVDRDIMQRNFNTWMRREGKMSTRMLDVDFDYERRFILVDDAVGQKIDQGLEFLSQAENGRYRPLANILWDKFDYLARSRLLQAIKARAAIPIIQAHHALGRKVVVFYDLNEGGGSNVFNFDDLLTSDMSVGNVPVKGQSDKISFDRLQTETVALSDLAKEFRALKPDLWRLDFSSYLSPDSTTARSRRKSA
jgi:hypothetical protein